MIKEQRPACCNKKMWKGVSYTSRKEHTQYYYCGVCRGRKVIKSSMPHEVVIPSKAKMWVDV